MIESITQTFQNNIYYIQKNHPKLFSKLSALDNAVENGYYQEKYELIYEGNRFDVLEKESKNYLYDKKSDEYNFLVAKSIDFQVEENLFEGFDRENISDKELEKFRDVPSFEYHKSGFAPIIHFTQNHQEKEKELKSIDKFIFFGVGLGVHIETIAQKLHSKVYFIVEDDLELFRLSLFTTNYQQLAKSATLIFSVFEDVKEFQESANFFLNTQYYYNHYLKYFSMLNHSEEKRYQFHIALTSQSHTRFFYNSLLTQSMRPLHYIFDNYNFLGDTISFKDLDTKPFLLLAAGPSLEKNMGWLRENYKKFTIVAVSAIAHTLEKERIVPAIITHLDPFKNATKHFKKIKSMEFFKDTLLFCVARTAQEIVTLFDKKSIFFFESGTNYKKSSLKISAPCIGSASYQLLLKLDVKELYLLGLDLAVDRKTGQTHSKNHQFSKTLNLEMDSKKEELLTYKESLIQVEGNLYDIAFTTPHFKTSLDIINLSSQYYKKEYQHIYNLSDGVKFEDTISLESKEIVLEKENSTQNLFLKNIIEKNSSISLTQDEYEEIVAKLYYTDELIGKIKSIKTLENIKEFVAFIVKKERLKKYELHKVIDTYMRYILSYIFDFYNAKESKTQGEIETLFIQHLLEICNYYKIELKNSIEREKNSARD